jgi:hypothetical protein
VQMAWGHSHRAFTDYPITPEMSAALYLFVAECIPAAPLKSIRNSHLTQLLTNLLKAQSSDLPHWLPDTWKRRQDPNFAIR